jgi:uncharacterized protein (DUF4415 family)
MSGMTHLTPAEIADQLKISVDTVRSIFGEMPGVVKIERPRANRKARPYVTLRIPAPVFEEWHRQHSGGWQAEVESRRRRVQKPLMARNERRVMPLSSADRGVA